MYLLFETDYTANELIAIGDGSYLKLINCEERVGLLPITLRH
jgi:hypothetical protein